MKNQELSACETNIMKAIWDAEKDISIPDLIEVLRTRFDKDYARTTVVTFLMKMENKGFVSTYRVGKLSYAHAEKSEADYIAELAERETGFWFGGRASAYLTSLFRMKPLTKHEADAIRRLIDELDD